MIYTDREIVAIVNGEKMDGTRPYEILYLDRKGLIIKSFNIWADNKGEATRIAHEYSMRISPVPYSRLMINCLKKVGWN
jgi:hypothetical protein